jgi:hypothetical protein
MKHDEMVMDLLQRSIDDWVHAGEFLDVAKQYHPDLGQEPWRYLIIGLACTLVRSGLMTPYKMIPGDFEPWEGDMESHFVRLIDGWMDVDMSYVTPGLVCWLRNTDEGQAIALKSLGLEE